MRARAAVTLLLLFLAAAVATIRVSAYGGSAGITVSTMNITQYIYVITTYAIPKKVLISDTESITAYQTGYQANVTAVIEARLVFVGAVGLIVIAPSYVMICDTPYPFTITMIYTNGTPAYWVKVCVSTSWNMTMCGYTGTTGQIVFYLDPPDYGLYTVNVTVSNVTVWTSEIRYVQCFGALTTTPPLPQVPYPPQPNVTVIPVNVSGFNSSLPLIAQPRLDTPTGIVIAASLAAIWAWMASRIGVGDATIVLGFLLSAIGGVYDNTALVVAGGLAIISGFVYNRLRG